MTQHPKIILITMELQRFYPHDERSGNSAAAGGMFRSRHLATRNNLTQLELDRFSSQHRGHIPH